MSIHLCFICDGKQHNIEVKDGQVELYTPLSIWNPAIVKENTLYFPEGWHVHNESAPPTYQIDLDREANHTLVCDGHHARLMVRHGGTERLQSLSVLTTARFSVGRAHTNELCCRDSYLSSYHGVFFYDREGALWYEDTSTNGTFINGMQIRGEKRRLHRGEQLDFPPLMHVVTDGGVLHIRCPKEHVQISLASLPADKARLNTAVFNQQTGCLYHIQLDPQINTLAGFRACAAAQMSQEGQYMTSSCMLRDADTHSLITSDADFCQLLKNGAPTFVML